MANDLEKNAIKIGNRLVRTFHYLALFAIGSAIVWSAFFAFMDMAENRAASKGRYQAASRSLVARATYCGDRGRLRCTDDAGASSSSVLSTGTLFECERKSFAVASSRLHVSTNVAMSREHAATISLSCAALARETSSSIFVLARRHSMENWSSSPLITP